MRDAQLLSRVESSALTAQPLAVQKARARELRTYSRPVQPLNRFRVEMLGLVTAAEERARARLDTEGPVGTGDLRPLEQAVRASSWQNSPRGWCSHAR